MFDQVRPQEKATSPPPGPGRAEPRPQPANLQPAKLRPAARNPYPGPRVAYVMSRFPKLTETFVLYEIIAMEEQDVAVSIYPLLRENPDVIHDDAAPLVARANYTPFFSWDILRSNLRALRRQPAAYLGALRDVVRGAWGSPRFLAGGLAIFPKAVHMAQHMQQEGIEHVHAHFASHPAMAAFIIRRLSGIPYSFTAHGSDIHRDQQMLRQKVAEADFVVPISTFNRDFILQHAGGLKTGEGFADKMVVIHCGVDTTRFRPGPDRNGHHPRPSTGRSLQTFHLLCTGTLHEVKGQTHLLAALAQLRRSGLDVYCHLVGDGPDRAALQQQARDAGLQDVVHFHGQQTRDEVLHHLQQADVLVAPSVPSRDGRREGIPVSIMEGMACGLPVIASRLSGIPELVQDGENGLLVPPGDVDALVAAIGRLLDDPGLRRKLGMAARRRIQTDFDLSRNTARLAQRFREVVA